ncbi:unnamed protein product, partial [Gulo gulo]
AWIVLLLGLLTYGSGVDSQNVVTQLPSLTISPGGTVTLNCALSSGSVSTDHCLSWYQQTPGQPPHMIIYSTISCPSGVPDHFSGSISGNKATLTITGAQPEDEADYYCVLCLNFSVLEAGEKMRGDSQQHHGKGGSLAHSPLQWFLVICPILNFTRVCPSLQCDPPNPRLHPSFSDYSYGEGAHIQNISTNRDTQ